MTVKTLIGLEFNEYQLCAVVLELRRARWRVCGRYWQEFGQRISLFDEPIKLAPLLAQFKKLRKQIPSKAKHVALVLPDHWIMQKTMQIAKGLSDDDLHHTLRDKLAEAPLSIHDVALDFCPDLLPAQNQPIHEFASMTQSVRVVTLKKRLQTTLINQLKRAGFSAYFFGPHTHALMSVNHWINQEKSPPWVNLHLSQTQWSAVLDNHTLCRFWQPSQLNLSKENSPYQIEQSHVIAALNKVLLQIELTADEKNSAGIGGIWLSCDFDSEVKIVENLQPHSLCVEPMPPQIETSTLEVGIAPLTGERMMLLATGVALCAVSWGDHHAMV